MKKMKARLRDDRGESLAEVLIALLVSSLALVMLALMVQSTNAMVQMSKDSMHRYMKANNGVVEKTGEVPAGGSDGAPEETTPETGPDAEGDEEPGHAAVVSVSSGSLQFLTKPSSDSGNERLTKLTDESSDSISVVYYINDAVPHASVVSYKKGS